MLSRCTLVPSQLEFQNAAWNVSAGLWSDGGSLLQNFERELLHVKSSAEESQL
jgi:hypothetical protein